MKKLTRQKAIEAKCKDCCYDHLDVGNWRMQTGSCTAKDCPLWVYRPQSSKK